VARFVRIGGTDIHLLHSNGACQTREITTDLKYEVMPLKQPPQQLKCVATEKINQKEMFRGTCKSCSI